MWNNCVCGQLWLNAAPILCIGFSYDMPRTSTISYTLNLQSSKTTSACTNLTVLSRRIVVDKSSVTVPVIRCKICKIIDLWTHPRISDRNNKNWEYLSISKRLKGLRTILFKNLSSTSLSMTVSFGYLFFQLKSHRQHILFSFRVACKFCIITS